jgi:hypothetical protein
LIEQRHLENDLWRCGIIRVLLQVCGHGIEIEGSAVLLGQLR